MEGIEGTAIQQVKSTLRCTKCSKDLSSSLPPLGFLRISPQPQGSPKPLVYLTCKHIVHYSCIDNPRKLCPICPSTDMEIDDLETPTEQSSSTAQKKRSSEFASEKDSNKKAKQTRKQIDRNDSPTLKKLIMELTSPESLEDGLPRDPLITLQSSVSEIDVNSLDFLELYNKISTAEDNLRRTTHDLIRSYYNFGQAIKLLFDHFRKTCNEDVSNAKVNDRIMNQIPVQDKLTETNLRKRKERSKKVFRLFSNVGGIEAIERLKSFNATTILNLSPDDVNFLIARLNE
jgi:hypothetical protein